MTAVWSWLQSTVVYTLESAFVPNHLYLCPGRARPRPGLATNDVYATPHLLLFLFERCASDAVTDPDNRARKGNSRDSEGPSLVGLLKIHTLRRSL